MEKVWLPHYQAGVPAFIDPDKHPTIIHLFERACRDYADLPSFTNMGCTLTYRELDEKSRAFAAYLQGVLGLKKGAHVMIMLPNILQYPIAVFGILRAGLVVININPLYTARELEIQLKDSGAETIIVLENFAHTVEAVLYKVNLKNVIVTEIGDLLSYPKSRLVNWAVKYLKRMVPKWKIEGALPFNLVMAEGVKALSSFLTPDMTGEDLAFLQYTGGTTGVPKGAMLTHRNIVANIEQAYAWIKPVVIPGEEIIITALPLYHIFSLLANCLTFTRIGALNVLITNPRDIPGMIRILSKYKFTAITGVNTLFNALLHNPKFSKLNFSALRIALGGGMAVQQVIAERWKRTTGVTLLEAYGLTETSPAVCINPLDLKEFNGSVGLPISSTEVSIRDEAGKELSFDTPGELWVRGPQVTQGYWKQPQETKIALQNGWVRTGDIATVDTQGFVRIIDRKKDMILVSGFNVYPNEVEEVIAMMPEVKEVAVVGIPHNGEEKVKAFIVKKDSNLTKDTVFRYCHEQLTGYKVPKEIEFRTELPKSTVGKILRRALREGASQDKGKK